jgi:hypothetical protein
MVKIILKAFLLMTFAIAAGLSSGRAQQSTSDLTGEWVGNTNTPDRSELVRLTLTENAGEIRFTVAAGMFGYWSQPPLRC